MISALVLCYLLTPIAKADFSIQMKEKIEAAKDAIEKHKRKKSETEKVVKSDTVTKILGVQEETDLMKIPLLRSMCGVTANDPVFAETTGTFCDSASAEEPGVIASSNEKKQCECASSLLPFLISIVGALRDDSDFQIYISTQDTGLSKIKRSELLSRYSLKCGSLYRTSNADSREPSLQTIESLKNLCVDFVSSSLATPRGEAK